MFNGIILELLLKNNNPNVITKIMNENDFICLDINLEYGKV
jgi:hypothetical protein